MLIKRWIVSGVCALAIASTTLSVAAEKTTPRFMPITEDNLTAEQKATPSIKRALTAGTYNPNGFDVLMLRNPGLQEAQFQLAMEVMLGTPGDKVTLPKDLRELAIMLVAGKWKNETLLKGHAPGAIKAGLTQSILDAITANERPTEMTSAQSAVYDFGYELLDTHFVTDATFRGLRNHLNEREVIDLISVMGMYTSSVMLLNVADIKSH